MTNIKRVIIFILILIQSSGICYSMDAPERLNISGEVVVVRETLKCNYIQSSINKKSKFKVNDIILKVYDKKSGLSIPKKALDNPYILEGLDLTATIIRSNNKINIPITYKDFVGVVMTNTFSYVATITALEDNNNFVGLSHSATIGENILTNEMVLSSSIYKVDYIEAKKRSFLGMSNISPKIHGFEVIGKVEGYIKHGMKGIMYNRKCCFLEVETATPKVGKAQIYCKSPSTNKFSFFNIEILEVDDEVSSIKITDEELLKYNGGLLKGMSGSPVIQDGKLIGGVRSSTNLRKNLGRITNIDAMFKE